MRNKGIIKAVVLVVLALLIVAYFGFDIAKYIDTKKLVSIGERILTFIINIWEQYLSPLWERYLEPIVELIWTKVLELYTQVKKS